MEFSEKNPSFKMNTRIEGNLSVVPHQSQPNFFGDGSLMVDEEILCDTFSAATPGNALLLKDAITVTHQYEKPLAPTVGQTQIYPDPAFGGRFVMVSADGRLVDLNPLTHRGDTMVFDGLVQTPRRLPIGLPGQVYTVDPIGSSLGSSIGWRSQVYAAHDIARGPTSLRLRYSARSLTADTPFAALDGGHVILDSVDRADAGAFTGGSVTADGIYESWAQIHLRSAGPVTMTSGFAVDTQAVKTTDPAVEIEAGSGPITQTTASIPWISQVTAGQSHSVTLTGGAVLAGSTVCMIKLDTLCLFARYNNGPIQGNNVPWGPATVQQGDVAVTAGAGGTFTATAAATYHVWGSLTSPQDGSIDATVQKNGQPGRRFVGRGRVPFEAVIAAAPNDVVTVLTTGSALQTGAVAITRVREHEACVVMQGQSDLTANGFARVSSVTVADGGTYRISTIATLQSVEEGAYMLRLAVEEKELQNSAFYATIGSNGTKSAHGLALAYLPPNTIVTLQGVSVQGSVATCSAQTVLRKYEATVSPFKGYSEFGRFFRSKGVTTPFSTTSTVFRECARLVTGDIAGGRYRLSALADWTMARSGTEMQLRTMVDGAEVDRYSMNPSVAHPFRAHMSALLTLSTGDHVITVEVRTTDVKHAVQVVKSTIETFLVER